MTSSLIREASSSYPLECPGLISKRGEASFHSHSYTDSTIFGSQIYVFFFFPFASAFRLVSVSLGWVLPIVHTFPDYTSIDAIQNEISFLNVQQE
jgi:hypothetical protein